MQHHKIQSRVRGLAAFTLLAFLGAMVPVAPAAPVSVAGTTEPSASVRRSLSGAQSDQGMRIVAVSPGEPPAPLQPTAPARPQLR